jgi:hypothetical protein
LSIDVLFKPNLLPPDFERKLKNVNVKVNVTRMVIFNLPNTKDPDTGKPCRHQCDVSGLGVAALYESKTRRLIIYPNKLPSMEDYLVSCIITDYGATPKTKNRYFFISFIRPYEQAK